MALELRPNCECCDKNLPPDATDARICSFECTFCATCVETVLSNVCPNCGGGFAPRSPSTTRMRLSWTHDEIADFVRAIAPIPPEER